MEGDFLEAVKRRVLSRLQLRGRPNIMHAVPWAAVVAALRGLNTGCVLGDRRVEIPRINGRASLGADDSEGISWFVSFARAGSLTPSRVRLFLPL